MIKQAFDHPNNTDYDSYKRKSGFGGVIFAGVDTTVQTVPLISVKLCQ